MRFKAAAVHLLCTGTAFAFQLHPNRILWKRNVAISGRKLLKPIYASGFSDDSPPDAAAAAPSAASSAFDDMLEKFALPLEFKSSPKDNVKVDAAEDKVEVKAGDSTNIQDANNKNTPADADKSAASTDNSMAATAQPLSTAETKVQKVEDKNNVQVVNEKVQATNAETKEAPKQIKKESVPDTDAMIVQKVDEKKEQAAKVVVQKVDEKKVQAAKEAVQKVDDISKKYQPAEDKDVKAVVQKVVEKKEQVVKVEETKVVQSVDDKKEKVTKQEEATPPATTKQEEATPPATTKQEEATPPATTTTFGPIVTPRRGFSDFGAPSRAEPKIKWDFGEETTRMKPTALGVNPNRKLDVVKMEKTEEPMVKEQQSPVTKKEADASSAKDTSVKSEDTPAVKQQPNPVTKKDDGPSSAVEKAVTKPSETSAKDTAAKSVDANALKPAPSSTEIAPSSSSSGLIQTQPLSLPSITLPESLRNVNLEDPGIIAGGTVVLGIALSLALVQNMNKADKSTDNEEEDDEPEPNLIQKVKDAGVAGAISYALWEFGFWGVSIPICVVGYNKFTGHWPDLSNSEDMKQLGGEIFAFANVARLAVPLRIGLALSTAPWIDENIVQKFRKDDGADEQVDMEEVALEEENFVEQGELVGEEEIHMSTEDEEWSGDEWQGEEMDYGYEANGEEWQEEMAYGDEGDEQLSQWSDFEERLSNIEANAMHVASVLGASQSQDSDSGRMASLPGSGYLNYIDEYCEPGTRSSNCEGAIKGYLDGLASTGAVASEREVTTIVGYLDSLSSNTTPDGPSRTGAAFTTYLDALSSGAAPSPPSAQAVAGYLDDLTDGSSEGSVGMRVVDIEGRLNKLESSISSLPDDIASRIINWQDSQDKKMSEELEKIKRMLQDTKS